MLRTKTSFNPAQVTISSAPLHQLRPRIITRPISPTRSAPPWGRPRASASRVRRGPPDRPHDCAQRIEPFRQLPQINSKAFHSTAHGRKIASTARADHTVSIARMASRRLSTSGSDPFSCVSNHS
jgi:hypothetical protein